MFNSRAVSLFYTDLQSEGREYLSEKQQESIDKINQPRPFGYILDKIRKEWHWLVGSAISLSCIIRTCLPQASL